MPTKFFLPALLLTALAFVGCKKEIVPETPTPISPTMEQIEDKLFSSIDKDSADTYFLYDQGANSKYTTHKYQGCPSIGFSNNVYYAAWISGGKGEQLGNYITVATSTNEGATWSRHELIITSDRDTVRHVDPMFWKDSGGALHLSWSKSIGMWDGGQGGIWHVKIKKNSSNKIVITQPSKLFNGTINVKPSVLMKDTSTMIFPVSGWNIPNPWNGYPTINTPREENGPKVFLSKYNLITKNVGTPVKIARIYDTLKDRNFDEHMIVDMGNDLFQCLLRTESGVFISKSLDAGKNWTVPVKFTQLGTTCATRIFFGRLKSGNLLIVLNNSTVRNNLKAFLSTDNGTTWPYSMLIDNRNDSSYPDIIQNSKGEICMIYDRDRAVSQDMIFKKFSESTLINNKTDQIFTSLIGSKDLL